MYFAVALSTFFLGVTACFSSDLKSLPISMERAAQGYRASSSLVFFEDHSELVRNSNLGCAPSRMVEVGAFSRKEKASIKRDFFEQVRLRIVARKQPPVSQKVPEKTYYSVANLDITDEVEYARAVELEFQRSCPGKVRWTPQKSAAKLEFNLDHIAVTPSTAKGTWDVAKKSKLTLKQARCTPQGDAELICAVPGWGQIFFSKKN